MLAEDKLTFKKAYEIVQAIELAGRNTCELKAAESGEVQVVSDRHNSTKKKGDQPLSLGPKNVGIIVEDNIKQRFANSNREMLKVWQGWPYI